jgi:hypothetical protein
VTLFDDADALLREALQVSAHARAEDATAGIAPGDAFTAVVTVENAGLGDRDGTHARTAFTHITLRVEATPFAAPVVDGATVRDVTLEVGELIYGEASSHEVPMRAVAALDGPEPFARVHVHGGLDLRRFFAVGAVHQFTTEIHRTPAQDPATEALRRTLLDRVLPEGFDLRAWSFDFDDEPGFLAIADDPGRFRAFVRERVVELAEARGLASAAVTASANVLEDLYVDVHETGYTGALALGLWFMGFDQGESIAFDEVVALARDHLGGMGTFEERRELRLFKGFENDGTLADPITVIDLPVVVDYRARTLTLWAGSLSAG